MAKLLFKGSVATLNQYYPGIDLVVPLVLKDGQISFVGIKVLYVTKENLVDEEVKKVSQQMIFPKMFSDQQSDRPFCLIIFAIGEYDFKISSESAMRRRHWPHFRIL